MITDTSLHVTYKSKAKSTLPSMSFSSSMRSVSGEGCGVRRWQWLMKLTGVCGHSCLMYCCSPHRISWMPRCEYWVFHHKFTQLFTQRASVVSQQAYFDVVCCGPTCLSPLAVDFQGPAVFIPWCFWLKSFSQFLEVVITMREVEKVLRSSAENFLFFDKRTIPLVRAVLGRRRRN